MNTISKEAIIFYPITEKKIVHALKNTTKIHRYYNLVCSDRIE